MTTDRKNPPLVVLGLDAGDPNFIRDWARAGYLPTIASIMERGFCGQTAGSDLVTEHGVWLSLFSGISRSQHGYYYFRQLKPGTYDLETVTGPQIDAPPFWSYLRERDKTIAIIDVPDNRPLPGLSGVQIANWATHNNWDPKHFTTASEPAELVGEIYQKFGAQMVAVEKANSTVAEDKQIYRQLLSHVQKKGALCRHLLTGQRFDVVVVVFAESHAASHQFWKYRPERRDVRIGEDGLTDSIRSVYQAIDREMGLLLAQLPRESNVFIVSSVGMEDHYPTTELIAAFFRQLGYQAPASTNDFSIRPIDLVRRVVPEKWRIVLSRYLSRERRERLLADQFRHGTNWHKTKAFSIPAYYTSFVRVNLRGREPEGIIEPGAEYEALLDRIEADLKQLKDPESNEPAVKRLARATDLFGCQRHVSLPDLFVHWKPGHLMRRAVHPRAELMQTKFEFLRVSDHSDHGFVAAAGPSIHAGGDHGDIPLLNLAPTFLSLIGEPIPPRMTGRTIDEAYGRESLAERPRR